MSKQQLLKDLIAAKALIDTPEKWTQGEYAIDSHGDPLYGLAMASATCMCSIGALCAATGLTPGDAEQSGAAEVLSTAAAGEPSKGASAIVHYNDEHDHAEVMAVWDSAIAAAQVAVQIENLETLLAAVEAQPLTLFDLSHYQQKTTCGTMFCTAGLATTLPHFQQQGFVMEVDKMGYTTTGTFTGVKVGEKWIFDEGVARDHFGADFDDLFSPAGCGGRDDELRYEAGFCADEEVANMTDKELAVARLKFAIEQLKQY